MAKTKTKAALTAEQQLEADRHAALLVQIAQRQAHRFGELIASRPDDELFGAMEFDLRDLAHQIAAEFLTAALEERKKGGTEDRVLSALTADQMPR